jgi:adiponectin receptor
MEKRKTSSISCDNHSEDSSSENEDIPLSVLPSDLESPTTSDIFDEYKLLYTYKELKQSKLFFVKRDHIKYHYRAHPQMTASMCLQSLFTLHNETMNVLSHLIPGLYFLAHLVCIVSKSHCYSVFKLPQSFIIQAIQALVIVICMLSSACYHLFMPMGEWHYHLLLKLDLVGIGLMIFGLTLSAVYVGFHNY